MKKEQLKLLSELLKDSKRSDREIARVMGIAQSSVSRNRKKLLEDETIREYTIIPDFLKIGFEFLSITCFRGKFSEDDIVKAEKWTESKPEVIFSGDAHGMGKNSVVIAIHKNFSEYSNYSIDLMKEASERVVEVESLLISFKGLRVKQFSMKQIAKIIENSENSQLENSKKQAVELVSP